MLDNALFLSGRNSFPPTHHINPIVVHVGDTCDMKVLNNFLMPVDVAALSNWVRWKVLKHHIHDVFGGIWLKNESARPVPRPLNNLTVEIYKKLKYLEQNLYSLSKLQSR